MLTEGNFIGVDVGKARVGVAQALGAGGFALPLKTLNVGQDGSEMGELVEIISSVKASAVFVGLPKLLSGKEGEAARMSRSYARRIARLVRPVPVYMIDERLTSVQSHGLLRDAGVPMREQRAMIDQVAASMILDQALKMMNHNEEIPGELVMID